MYFLFSVKILTVFTEQDEEWRWHIKDKDNKGDIITASPKSFGTKKACVANLKLLGDKTLLFCGAEKRKECES